jgi:undecaprenyl-diphosphatase
MDAQWAAVLGAVQGLTEFLPISSSGHLAACGLLARRFGLGAVDVSPSLMFGVLLHVATLAAVVIYFRAHVADALRGVPRGVAAIARGRFGEAARTDAGVGLALAVCVGTIPTGVIGLLIKGPTERIEGAPVALGMCFLSTAALLAATRWWSGGARRLDWRAALVIGIVQGIAVLPGVSRSGATIAAGLALGLPREEAVRFSFLLSVPAIAGAALLEVRPREIALGGQGLAVAIGCAAAFAIGIVSLVLLRRIVGGGRLWWFAPYVAAVGAALFAAA